MKLSFIIILQCIFLHTGCNSAISGPKIFIGYFNTHPIFHDYEENKLYLFNSIFEELKSYPRDNFPKKVLNNFICYQTKKFGNYQIIVSDGKSENSFDHKSEITFLAISNEGVLYFTDNADNSIKTFNGTIINDLGLKGDVIDIVDNNLYFSNIHDIQLVYSNADIYIYDLIKLDLPKKVLINVSGESTVICPNGDYIYDKILSSGEFVPTIFDMRTNKSLKLQIDGRFLNATPFFTFNKKELTFYDWETMEFKTINLEDYFK